MRKQRFTNGVKKVLRRNSSDTSSPTEIFNRNAIWEKGPGVFSAQTKGTNCIAFADYSIAKGYDAYSYLSHMQAYSIENKYKNDVSRMQKCEMNLHLYIDKDGDFFFKTGAGIDITLPSRTFIKGRFMAELFVLGDSRMTSWSGIVSINNESGTIVIRQSTVTKEADENSSNYTFSITSDGDRLQFKMNSKNSYKAYGILNFEWIEMTKA